ncbi:MAG: hypothetical protein COA73_05675 [Candidatus Hydrogenedentota bacterium]|nr:MAG: hypothetical protein COA73_05675 [Candidatus Hydrogenedentota bacterium]
MNYSRLFLVVLCLVSASSAAEEPRHVKVYFEEGRFAGWPANNGMWTWGDEILVGFTQGYLGDPKVERGHLFARDKPTNGAFGRSMDGGETWEVTRQNFPAGPPKAMPTDLPLTDPKFILTARGKSMYTSNDKGHTWEGPWKLPFSESMTLEARTDYHVLGKKDLLLMLVAAKSNGNEGRPFSARTLDGGKTWNQFTWIGKQPETRFSIMPSSIRLESGRLLAAIRRREDVPFHNNNFIELFASDDNGLTWELLAVPTKDLGVRNGNSPYLLRLEDGRLCITTANRSAPSHIFAVFSEDDGVTWGKKRVLRGDGGGWDLGYTQSMQRSDGKVVTIYYFHETLHGERYIAATIWKP